MGKASKARKAKQAALRADRASRTDGLAARWIVTRNVSAELATVSVRTNQRQVPREGRIGGRGEHKIADPVTGREYHVRTNAAIVDGKVIPKIPAKPKAGKLHIKQRQAGDANTFQKAVRNRFKADIEARADGELQSARRPVQEVTIRAKKRELTIPDRGPERFKSAQEAFAELKAQLI